MSDPTTNAGSTDPRIEAALHDYLERLDRGEPVDREKFLARHSPIADQLRSFIAAEDEVRKLAEADTPLDRAQDSTKSFVGHGQETVAPQLAVKQDANSGGSGLSGQFGRYRIIRALGKGAMGTVYLAEDTHIERPVALKTPHFTEDPTGEQRERFFREARAAGNLRHANICPIHDFGQIDGKHYISMAYIEGRPLSAFIKPDKPQTERQILIVVRKLALALQEAHDHEIVHRDLKPANIMVDKKGEPIIMDFGLAQQVRRNDDVRLTQTGNILGTPAYMSPEQVEGEPEKIGPATDQYSLGVILYELLTGQLPFRGSVIAVMGQILTKEVTPPSQSRSGLDPRIEAVCLKMMAKTPSERFASLKAVADELATILKSPAAKVKLEDTGGQAPQPKHTGGQTASATQSSADRLRADAGASQALKSLKQKTLTESDLASLEELARKCYSRRDFEQVIQIIERIPEEKRSAGLVALLEKTRGKADEIAFLICDIDEAERLNDGPTALKKAEALLKLKPGHHRALGIQEKYSGYGEGGAARIGVLDQFRRPLNDGGWIPWSVLAFGLAVFGVMTGVIVIYLGRTAVVIDIKDPGVEVAVKGTTLTITGPDKQSIKVVPGDQELTVSCAGFETVTKSFSLKKGDKQTVTVSIADSKLVARLENEIAPPTTPYEEQKTAPPPVDQRGESPLAHAAKQADAATVKASVPQLLVAPFSEATAKNAQQEWAVRLKTTVERTNSIGMKLSLIPPGTFTMGSPKEEKGRGKNEDPVRVTLTKAFWLGQHEVSQSEWRRVMQTTPWIGKINSKDGDDYPATYVDWADAMEFCTKMTEIEHRAGLLQPGLKYVLPTEAQWEYACRAGTTTRYSFGDEEEDLSTHGWFKQNAIDVGQKHPHQIGQKRTNAWGLFDMHGNVWEWCRDAYREKLPGGTDPEVSNGSSVRVNRSGCWGNPAGSCRSASRYGRETSESRRDSLGFRVACDATSPPTTTGANTAETDGFVPLFNGKDLTGWKTHPSQPGNWRVEDGVLIGSGADRSHLYSERDDFKDFHLRLVARVSDGGKTGVYFRAPFGPNMPLKLKQPLSPSNKAAWLTGYNAKIDAARFGGLLIGAIPGLQRIRETVLKPQEWFTFEVIAEGNRIVIKVDGQTTCDYTDESGNYTSGHIALQQHTPSRVEFRKIEIKELSPQSASTSVPNKDAASTPVDARDPFQPRSIWFTGEPRRVLTVTQRKGAIFQARFEVGPNITRMIKGTVKDGKVDWLAKDVRAIKGRAGGDNHGTVTRDDLGDKIDFVWGIDGKRKGEFTLRLQR